MAYGISEELHRAANHTRDVARRIDDRLPLSPAQSAEVTLPIAMQPLRLREEVRVRLTTVEERHSVTSPKGALNDGTAEELRTAENEEPHDSTIPNHRVAVT
jgi:hypothetical protein